MLIDSPRITDADRGHWRKLEMQDRINARRIGQHEIKALGHIKQFLDDGDAAVATSWGKDSVVVAHLVWRVDPAVRMWHWTCARSHDSAPNPDVPAVRDAFLDLCPMDYKEHHGEYGVSDQLGKINRDHEPRNIQGVRSAESRQRVMSAMVHGVATGRMCRPILHWPTWAVFAYLCKYDLPVHPAYSMTAGGLLERERLRVHSIGDERGRGVGRLEWEQRYYLDVLNGIG